MFKPHVIERMWARRRLGLWFGLICLVLVLPFPELAHSVTPKIAGGDVHSLGLKSDGTVWAWGDNFSGQLGDGTTEDRSTPVQVSGLSGVIGIAGGAGHSLALKSDGTVWAWGYNLYGRLGDGDRKSVV